jgi:hypothetical protein
LPPTLPDFMFTTPIFQNILDSACQCFEEYLPPNWETYITDLQHEIKEGHWAVIHPRIFAEMAADVARLGDIRLRIRQARTQNVNRGENNGMFPVGDRLFISSWDSKPLYHTNCCSFQSRCIEPSEQHKRRTTPQTSSLRLFCNHCRKPIRTPSYNTRSGQT